MTDQGSYSRWHSLRSNPITSTAMRLWGKTAVIPKMSGWVFCAGTGRCGTNTLADMMQAHPDTCALHEPYPQPSDTLLAHYGSDEAESISRLWENEKLPRMIFAARGNAFYLETTHLFVHRFAEHAVREFGDKMKVIHLHRDVHQTARSFLRRGQDPLHDPWLIDPLSPENVLDVATHVAPGAEFDDMYLRLIWYCHEVHARALRFKTRHPKTQLLDLATEDLNDRDAIAALMSDLGMTAHEDVLKTCGTRSNASAAPPSAPDNLDAGRIAAFEALLDATYQKTGLAEKTSVPTLLKT